MTVEETELEGVFIFTPQVFKDARGYFYESFNQNEFNKIVQTNIKFVQDNHAYSDKHILRGLHFQESPYEQGKLVRVSRGQVIDVIVDIRKKSKTFGKHLKVELSDKNHKILWVPPGFAHGYLTLENNTIFQYKVTNYYNPKSEKCLLWSDKKLNINWGLTNVLVSDKDKKGELLQNLSGLV